MLIIGIDPGLTGAIAVLNHRGEAIAVHDMPTMAIDGAGPATTIKREVDVRALYTLLRSIVPADESSLAILEHTNNVGKDNGMMGNLSLAASKAYVMAVLRLQGHQVRRVAPSVWKHMYGIKEPPKGSKEPDGKKQALRIARGHFGMEYVSREKDHNRAEAMLIARFGQARFA